MYNVAISHFCFLVLIFSYNLSSYLKPDLNKKSKRRTSVKRKTLNPEYNEVRIISYLLLKPPTTIYLNEERSSLSQFYIIKGVSF